MTSSQPTTIHHRHARTQTLLALILALSVVLRLGMALYLGDVVDAPPLLTDQRSYHTLGQRLLQGHGFSFGRGWYPFTPADTPTAHWSFLYSLFVAAVYAVSGPHPLAARLVQAVLGGLLLPWMVYRLAKSLTQGRNDARTARGQGQGVALVAAGIAAVYGYSVLYSATLMTETFYITAVLWSLERALALADDLEARRPPWGAAVGLGISLGLATLLRQSILPWVPVLFAWLLWRAWTHSRSAGTRWQWNLQTFKPFNLPTLFVAALVLLACILPFTIRNWLVYDDFLLLNSNAGYAMYSAQHPMHGTSFQAFAAAPLPDDLRGEGLNEAQWDRELMARGIGFVLDEPSRYLLLSLSRVASYFEFWPTETSLLHNVGRLASFTLFLPFMLYGTVLAARRTDGGHRPSSVVRRSLIHFSTSSVALLLLFMAFYSLLHILTWAMTRYRLPVDAVAVPFAALGIADLWERINARAVRG